MGPAALLLCSVLAAGARAQAPAAEAHENLSQVEAEVERTTSELEALARRLAALSQTYAAAPDFEALARERNALHDAALGKSGECSSASSRLRRLGEELDIRHGVRLLGGIADFKRRTDPAHRKPVMSLAYQGSLGAKVDSESRGTFDWRALQLDARRRRKAARQIIDEEERAFALAAKDHIRDKELRESAWGGAAVVALLLLAALWRLRSRLAADASPGQEPRTPAAAAPPAAALPEAPAQRPPELIALGPATDRRSRRKAALRLGAVLGGYKVRSRPAWDGGRPWAFASELRSRHGVVVRGASLPLPAEPDRRLSLLHAARALVMLRHEGIFPVRDGFEAEGRLYLVYDRPKGESLRDVLIREGRLPLETARSVFAQAAAALGAAHARGLLHQELTSSAILLTDDGVMVWDFGLDPGEAAKGARRRRPSRYSAPEQARGRGCKASDLFSLGVCAYETLTGARPFPGPDFLEQQRSMSFRPPSEAASGMPEGLDAFIRHALDPDPGQRFQSAGEFAAAFEAIAV